MKIYSAAGSGKKLLLMSMADATQLDSNARMLGSNDTFVDDQKITKVNKQTKKMVKKSGRDIFR